MILSLRGGGAERQLALLGSELARRGHDVHVAFIHDGENAAMLGGGCTLHRIAVRSKFDPRLWTRTAALVRRLRPDVMQTWLTHMDIAGGAAARLSRVPWVVSERSAAACYPASLLNRLRIAAGRRADLIVANSPGGAAYWTGLGIDPSRIEIVPNFVPVRDIESAAPLDDPRIASDDELLLAVGRLSPEKNLGAVIDALPEVVQARPRVRFALCGDGAILPELQARVAAAALNGRVIFAGFVPNVASWLKRAATVVAVSLYEGHPNAVLEAVAAGTPVIVSDIPAYRAILDGGAAAFVEPGDVRGIAAAIINTLDDRATAAQRAALARQALHALSLEATAERYETAYRRAIAHRS